MGRTEPSGRPKPQAFRRDVRAKEAKATLNKVIPSMLSAHPRARRGIDASELIAAPRARSPPPARGNRGNCTPERPRLTVRATDTLTAARSLLTNNSNSIDRVAILNMASPLSPGGGFLNGATSQEEFLCMRTTILPALKDDFYRLPEVGCIYTPDVLVFRSGMDGEDPVPVLTKNDRWFVDVVSAAMLRLPDTVMDEETGQGAFAQAKDRDLSVDKMRAVMRVFEAKGAVKVVLGAWGCGAYSNPLGEVARAWRRVLLGPKKKKSKSKGPGGGQPGETWSDIEEVQFAIKDQTMAEAFQLAFGDGLLEWVDESGGESDSEADLTVEGCSGGEQSQVEQLLKRIDELNLRIDCTSNSHLKGGLEAVVAGLQNQLSSASLLVNRAMGTRAGSEANGEDGASEEDTADEEDGAREEADAST